MSTPPPPSDEQTPPQDDQPQHSGTPQGKEGVSTGTAFALVGAGAVLVIAVIVGLGLWLAHSFASAGPLTLPGFGGGDRDQSADPAPTRSASDTTTPSAPRTPSAVVPSQASGSAEASAAASSSGEKRTPNAKALVSAHGVLRELTLDETEANAIRVPRHDGPVLVRWSNSGDTPTARLHLTGYEKPGGRITESFGAVLPGMSGATVVDGDPDRGSTGVIYVKGNSGVKWRVEVVPASETPGLSRGESVDGAGPAVFRVAAGEAQDYELGINGERGGSIKVYPADRLTYADEFEHRQGAGGIPVRFGAEELIVQVDTEEPWTLKPR